MIFIIIQVAIGGAAGAVSRYLTSVAFERVVGTDFPYATMAVNVGGSFLLGVVFVLLGGLNGDAARLGPLIMVGFLGGFTTFSTYSLDGWILFQNGRITEALLYIFGSVFLSLTAIVAGIFLTRFLHN
ncbi:MAG: fluoride efflux transporter CrcB [Acidiferrobacterales bacterium]|nr:fluoride efflux transporter CrcB [Acidiferrobacterales bacterium]